MEIFIIERSGLIEAISSSKEKPYRFNPDNTQEVLRLNALDSQEPLIRYSVEYLLTHFRHGLKNIINEEQLKFKLNNQKYILKVKPFTKNNLTWLIIVVNGF